MTLYRETPCEHGHMNMHDRKTGETIWSDTDPDMKLTCPGGSREEVTINYDAAEAIMLDLHVSWDAGAEEWARKIVNVALGVTT